MYKQVSANVSLVEREKEVERFWRENDIFRKTIDSRKEGPVYTFYDGPPTANGKPHIGHVETRTIKDMIPRYRTMKGCMVPRKAGWDTHGLPVELEVEKLLGLDGKEQIEEYGLAPFIDKCKESVWKYKGMWEEFSGSVGFWADMDDPYVTYHDDYIESEWWALKTIWDKGLLYKGFKIVPYCPRCGTPLSSHEVAQGYKAVKERSAVARFKCVGEEAYFLAWTTTPWTLPSNVALCVNPDEAYVKVKAADGYTYYMAQALLDTVLGGLAEEGTAAYQVLETYKGTDLEHKEYEPLFACSGEEAARQGKKAHYVTCDTYVTMSDGTGIVHIAPAFGEDDANVGRKYGLPLVQFVDGKGHMTEETPYAGKFVKDADADILKDLDKEGKLFSAPKFEHDYPFCWRCDTPLIYYARESWFIKMTAVKDDLVRNNKTINWIPPTIGEGRFGNWLENIQDWGISRNRYWGTPLNIWECQCGHMESVGSRDQLAALTGDERTKDVELHRPYIDEVTFPCPKCGKTMKRVPEVIDCWFDSGAMPFAQHHYPFENKDLFEQQFPADFISEAVDQTRGWFYSLLAESTLLFNKAPYENVIVLGLVADEDGQKMSKSKGNVVDPFQALEEYGADAIRWYFYTSAAPWLPKRFSGKTVLEGQHKFLDKLWNTYTFFVLYANIDGFDASKHTLEYEKLPVMDKWLLSRLNTVVGQVDADLDKYRIPEAAKALQDFVEEMSNWYVRRSRERFWAKGMEQDKINAYMTLHTALVTVCKAAAPMIPFMTEEIYRNLVCSCDASAPESVHLCDFPTAEERFIDKKLEADMEEVLEAVVLGRACRNAAAIKNRQPISRMYVKMGAGQTDSEGRSASGEGAAGAAAGISAEGGQDATGTVGTAQGLDGFCTAIIRDELNVKEVVYTEDVRDYTTYTFKPQLRTVGPKYGKQLGGIQKTLAALDGNAAMDELDASGKLAFEVNGAAVELTKDDLLIDMTQKPGYVSQENGRMTVVLDTNLTEELIEEGFVYELISKIQTMRKDAGFQVMDHIRVSVNGNGKLAAIAARNADSISGKVLAEELTEGKGFAVAKEWNVNGEKTVIAIEKA